MPKYINIESGHIFYNKKSIPLSNQKILGIKSLTKHNQFVLKNKKTNKIIKMGEV